MRSIRAQILYLFFLSAILIGIALSVVLFQLQRIGQLLDNLNIIYLPLAEEVSLLDTEIQQLKQQNKFHFFENETEQANRQLYIQSVNQHIERTQQLLKIQTRFSLPDIELKEYETIIEQMKTINQEHSSALKLWQETSRSKELHTLHKSPIELSLRSGRLFVHINEKIQTLGQEIATTRAQLNQISIGLSSLSIIFAFCISLFALRLLQPLQQLTELVKKIGSGAYGLRLKEDTSLIGSELRVLSKAVNKMAEAVEDRDRRLLERATLLNELYARLQLILDTMEPALIVVSNTEIIMANPAAQHNWNLKKGDELPEIWRRELGKAEEIEINGAFYDINLVPINKDDHLISIENVTDRIENRDRLKRVEQLALVGKMLAQVTHEVRNPLSAMSLNAELLLDEQLSEEGILIIEQLIKETERLETITERYLRLSRRRIHQPQKIHLQDLFKELLQSEEALLQNASIGLDIKQTNAVIIFDPELLMRVLINLLRNSVDASAQKISISCALESNHVLINVEDDGNGMDSVTQQSAFEPFFTTKPKGTGLGLAICKQELEMCEASLICLKSSENGTTFRLTIPIGL